VSEYLESELLARISPGQREFLTRAAVLERMSGPLCQAVLDLPGSGEALAGLARSNMLLVPLDHRGEWYRYHHLFRDMLLAELERLEPGLIPVLRRRAAAWYLANDLPEEALEYSIAAEDVEATARLVEKLWLPTYWQSRITTVQRWLRWLEEHGAVGAHPMIAVAAPGISTTTGRPAEAERWADMIDRWQNGDPARSADAYAEAWAALLRTMHCRRGVEQMLANVDEARRRFAEQDIVYPVVELFQGVALILSGDLDAADTSLEDAISIWETGAPDVLALAQGERSLLAMADGNWSRAEVLAGQARTVLRRARIEESYVTPLVCALQARAFLHRGDVPAARQELVTAQRLRPLLTYSLPHFAVQARLELARVHLALADLAGARTLMREIDSLLKRRPDLGTLGGEAKALRANLAKERDPAIVGASALTSAELRLLPMLSIHLPVHEIAAGMYLSPHTVKTQVRSIYRKLGATSRGQAVARSRELGLLEG